MRILLVEDDVMIGETVLDLLRAEHYAVDWVRDGEMADTALRTQAYDLVLLDLGLPRCAAHVLRCVAFEELRHRKPLLKLHLVHRHGWPPGWMRPSSTRTGSPREPAEESR